MGRVARGTVLQKDGGFFAQITVAKKRGRYSGREAEFLPTCTDWSAAEARTAVIADFVRRLREAGRDAFIRGTMTSAARASSAEKLEEIGRQVDGIVRGDEGPSRTAFRPSKRTTIRALGEAWTGGELHAAYPDHVKSKKTGDSDAYRLEKYVYPVVDDVPVASFTLDHAQEVMRLLPAHLKAGSRRQVAQLLSRLMTMAVFPIRLREHSPLPRGWLPKPGKRMARFYLYPNEEAALLGCKKITLIRRLLYGFLNREGMRKDEARRLEWTDITAAGEVQLDQNKTDDPRSWALDPSTFAAVKAWRGLQPKEHKRRRDGKAVPCTRVFDDGVGWIDFAQLAATLRKDMEEAELERAALFKVQTTERLRFRAHDLRGTFVTLSLANGKTETWVKDRTGHQGSDMIERYRSAARTSQELRLGPLHPLDRAIPELAPSGSQTQPQSQPASGGGSGRFGGRRGTPKTSGKVASRYARRAAMSANSNSGSSGVTLVGVQVPPFALRT